MFGHKSAPKAVGGVGYGGDAKQDEKIRKSGMKKAAKEENKRATEQRSFLKKSQKTMTSEEAPDDKLVGTIREVLRNQVPNEWSKRRGLYDAALECCHLISLHHPKTLGASDDDEAVMAALEEFAQHAELISKHDQVSTLTDKAFVDKILEVRKEAAAASKAVLERPEMSVMDPHEYYRQALRPLRFELVEELARHSFAKHPQNTRMDPRKLFRELTTYKTALPIEYGSSIFVRAMENRLDLLRVCITGPEDTPYANGAFIFDMYLSDYPRKAPQVKYLTTGGGRYRFNPNLYNDGKVCLSLLGTWNGPGWVSGESTILQILISIQSLILVNDPYFNEPGYDNSRGTPGGKRRSEGYNASIRKFTTEVCILPFLTQPCPYPEFDEAMLKHFRNKQSVLQKQLFQWYKDDATFETLYLKCSTTMDGDRASKRKARAPAAMPRKEIRTKTNDNGVIEIESDDEDAPVSTDKSKTTAREEVILLDDENDAKPAAVGREPVAALHASAAADVVDLT
jgi:ubiquitin-protein ligase